MVTQMGMNLASKMEMERKGKDDGRKVMILVVAATGSKMISRNKRSTDKRTTRIGSKTRKVSR